MGCLSTDHRLKGAAPSLCPAVTVDPLSHASRGDDSSRQDLATGYSSEGVLLAATTKADLNRASEGVGVDGAGAVAVLGIDGEHGSFAVESILQGQGCPCGQRVDSGSIVPIHPCLGFDAPRCFDGEQNANAHNEREQ
jgi:hypothetical protein